MGDLYAILGLGDKTFEAAESEIKSAYRKLALQFHPDKMGDNFQESDKQVWLQIQNAYETLSDVTRRRKYDSALPFDEEVPSDSDDITDENFFEIFNAVFLRNARFAKKKPVPNIGDASTPLEQVFKFYKFWDNFETWREFSQYDEYDTKEASDRYERRYMEKENKKVRDKYVKKERSRIIKLSEVSYKKDPRVKKFKEEEENEKVR